MARWRIFKNEGVVPSTATSLSLSSWETGALPTTIGAISVKIWARSRARASPMVRSRGTAPNRGGMPPVVSIRPGMTMRRLVPRLANRLTT